MMAHSACLHWISPSNIVREAQVCGTRKNSVGALQRSTGSLAGQKPAVQRLIMQ